MKGILTYSVAVARLHLCASRLHHGSGLLSSDTFKKLSKVVATSTYQKRCGATFVKSTHLIKQQPPVTVTHSKTFCTDQLQSLQPNDYLDTQDSRVFEILSTDMKVLKDFLTEEEEYSLLNEVEKYMRRLRYEFDHWDNAIHGYRETEKSSWNEENTEIIERVQELAFPKNTTPLAHVHVLDIARDGYIKPHVDAVRFCGDTIAGMCLLSPCVMRMALEKDKSKYGDVYLPRRCLYIMRGKARYDFTHEVLKDEESIFRKQFVPRDRRISIICRSEPDLADTEFY